MKKYPTLLDRTQSTLIDVVIIVLAMIFITNVFESFSNVPDWARIASFALIFVVYEPLCTSFGCTIGNYVKGIRVRKYADENSRINIIQAMVRYPTKLSLGFVSYFTIHSSPEKRAIHDLIAGSVMIKL